jgi:hypothetical protein
MEKKDIEIFIRGCVQKNQQLHPGAFSDLILKSIETAKALATAYWQHRTDSEVRRDANANVTQADYEVWVKTEFLKIKGPELCN